MSSGIARELEALKADIARNSEESDAQKEIYAAMVERSIGASIRKDFEKAEKEKHRKKGLFERILNIL